MIQQFCITYFFLKASNHVSIVVLKRPLLFVCRKTNNYAALINLATFLDNHGIPERESMQPRRLTHNRIVCVPAFNRINDASDFLPALHEIAYSRT